MSVNLYFIKKKKKEHAGRLTDRLDIKVNDHIVTSLKRNHQARLLRVYLLTTAQLSSVP